MAILDTVMFLVIGALGAIAQILCNKEWHHSRVGENALWLAIVYTAFIRPAIVWSIERRKPKVVPALPKPDPYAPPAGTPDQSNWLAYDDDPLAVRQ